MGQVMSEFKFACPVCGQHITTDSGSSGRQIGCPTCFRKIVIPQAPASEETKLILSAAQVAGPRPVPAGMGEELEARPRMPLLQRIAKAGLLLVLLGLAGASLWVLVGKTLLADTASRQPPVSRIPKPTYPVPHDIKWTLDLANAAFPGAVAAGRLRGAGFKCERATLQGGKLTLRQGGPGGVPVMGVAVHLFARRGEELSGKTIEITPNRAPPLPRVSLLWEDGRQQPGDNDILAGYALKLTFHKAANGRVAGEIYLCLPDASKSFVAGTFEAEIEQASDSNAR
jgi:DNA-directed RNA polymerase subunit RPC12/RpoP